LQFAGGALDYLSPLIFQRSKAIMSLVEQIAARDVERPFYTFEFFPPRTDQVRNFLKIINPESTLISTIRDSKI